MKINKIHINAFGKLSNFDLVLNDNFNVIYGDNEFGKSTLMAFIKMAFFGTASGKAGADRKKYQPWSGEKYAGSIDFTKDGVPYRIEREFAATNSHDKIRIINLMNNVANEVSPKEPLGEKLFGCTLSCFERTLFIGALNDEETENTVLGEINKKLANIVSSGEEDVSASAVSEKLLTLKHRFLSKGGKIGICDKAKQKAEEIRQTLLKEKLEYAEKEAALLKLDGIKENIALLQKEEETLKVDLEKSKVFEDAKLLKEFVLLSENLKALKTKLTCKDGLLLNENRIFTIKQLEEKIKDVKVNVENKRTALENNYSLNENSGDDNLQKLSETLLTLKTEVEKKENAAKDAEILTFKSKVSVPGLISLFIGITLSAAGFFMNHLLLLYCLGGAALILFFVLQLATSKKVKTANKNYLMLREEVLSAKEKLQTLSNEINLIKQENQQSSSLKLFAINQKKEELIAEKEKLSDLQKEYNLLFENLPAAVGFTDEEKINSLSQLLKELNSLEGKVEILHLNLNVDLNGAKDILSKLENCDEVNVSAKEIEQKIEDVQKKRQQLSEDFYRLENSISVKYHALHVPAVLEKELLEIESETKKQEEFCNTIDIALKVLEEAGDEMQNSWGGELNGKVSEIFSRITGEKYTDVLVSKNLGLAANEKDSFGLKKIEDLSAGTKDQSYFALRLALCDLIFGQSNTFPVFLDDSFERYDDTRAKRALEFLKEFSKDKQVLLFTCHKQFLNLIEN